MRPVFSWGPRTAAALAVAVLGLANAQAPAVDPADAGRRLFQHGVDRNGVPIEAHVGIGARLPGAAAACAKCHGTGGRGSRDAGLQVPGVQWALLTRDKPAEAGSLARSAYTEATLLRALREGMNADGQPLAAAMPRFQLGARAEADLLTYLQSLGTERERVPGVEPDRLVLGTVVPRSSQGSAALQAHRHALRACTERANREGGVHGRQIVVQEWWADDAAADALLAPPWLDQAFALVAPWWPQQSAAALSRALGPMPVVGPLGMAAELWGATPWWFGVAPVPSDQIRVAMDLAALAALDAGTASRAAKRRLPRVVVVESSVPGAASASLTREVVERQLGLHPEVEWSVVDTAGLASTLRQNPPHAVVTAGSIDTLQRVAQAMDDARLPPSARLWGLASQAGAAVLQWPTGLQGRLRLISAGVGAEDFQPQSLEADLRAIGARIEVPAVQSLAYGAACATVEALRLAGRQLDRDRLVQALTGIHQFRTGVLPPLSWGHRQRHGAWHSRVLKIEAPAGRLAPDSGWISPREPG